MARSKKSIFFKESLSLSSGATVAATSDVTRRYPEHIRRPVREGEGRQRSAASAGAYAGGTRARGEATTLLQMRPQRFYE